MGVCVRLTMSPPSTSYFFNSITGIKKRRRRYHQKTSPTLIVTVDFSLFTPKSSVPDIYVVGPLVPLYTVDKLYGFKSQLGPFIHQISITYLSRLTVNKSGR